MNTKGTVVNTRFAKIVMLFLAACIVPSANAQSINPTLDDVVQLRLGPFFANFDTTVNIQGSPFDQEQLDDSQETFAGYVHWRITPKLHLRVGYSEISDDETTTTSQPIGGIPGTAGTTLSQDYKTSSLPIWLAYAFVKNPKTEFGVVAGVTITTIKNRISITPPGGPTISPINQDITEPLPGIGLFWNQAFSPKWALIANATYLGLEVGGLDGDFYSAQGGIEFRPWKNVGLGGAYLYNKADGTITASGTTSTFDYQYDGPFAYLMIGGGTR